MTKPCCMPSIRSGRCACRCHGRRGRLQHRRNLDELTHARGPADGYSRRYRFGDDVLAQRRCDVFSWGCGAPLQRIGEDVTEKLDYTPGTFTVERHVRGKWVCRCCEALIQAPVPARVIDKGIPTEGLLAQVLVAKYADHLPLARQENIFARGGITKVTIIVWR